MNRFILLIYLSILLISCNQNNTKSKENKNVANQISNAIDTFKAVQSPNEILTNFTSFWNYYYKEVNLSYQFNTFNENKNNISKDAFFQQLNTGKYLPLKLIKKDAIAYQLYKLPKQVGVDITSLLKQMLDRDYNYYLMENKPIKGFQFTTIEDKIITATNTLGKIVVFKTWFIHCAPCVAEMPEVNEIVEKYKKRTDVVFISLATDKKQDLQNFIKKTIFKYPVVPVSMQYITENLKLHSFPTHFVLNKKGLVVGVTSKVDQLKYILTREIGE